jgi:ABC-type sulfate/molybdate transport systems ATPase subunit
LVRAPALLLLDEPTSALDVTARRSVRALLARHLSAPERCGVAVSHDVRDLLAWQPTVALIADGQIAEVGPLSTLRGAAQHPFLRELFAPLPD